MSSALFLLQDCQTPDLVEAFRKFKKSHEIPTGDMTDHLEFIRSKMNELSLEGIEKPSAEFLQMGLIIEELQTRGLKRI